MSLSSDEGFCEESVQPNEHLAGLLALEPRAGNFPFVHDDGCFVLANDNDYPNNNEVVLEPRDDAEGAAQGAVGLIENVIGEGDDPIDDEDLVTAELKFGPAGLGVAELGPAELGAAELWPAQLGVAELGPAELGAAELGAAQLLPAEDLRTATTDDFVGMDEGEKEETAEEQTYEKEIELEEEEEGNELHSVDDYFKKYDRPCGGAEAKITCARRDDSYLYKEQNGGPKELHQRQVSQLDSGISSQPDRHREQADLALEEATPAKAPNSRMDFNPETLGLCGQMCATQQQVSATTVQIENTLGLSLVFKEGTKCKVILNSIIVSGRIPYGHYVGLLDKARNVCLVDDEVISKDSDFMLITSPRPLKPVEYSLM